MGVKVVAANQEEEMVVVVVVETMVTEDTKALVPMDEEIVQGGADRAAVAVNLREAKAVDPV